MNILLTGATGFIGTNFLRYFRETNQSDNLILLSSKEFEGFTCINHKNYTFTKKNFLDVGIEQIDVIILLGAYVEKSKNDPGLVKKHLSSINNIDYLLNHLPNVPQKLVYCSSIAVYGFQQTKPMLYDESSMLNATTPYALSKCMGELFVTEWAKEHNCELQIVRIGSVYAGGEKVNNGFLGYAIKSACERKEFYVTISPQQIWNYVYVDDISRWILNSVFLEDSPGIINLTASRNYTTKEIMETIKQLEPSFSFVFEDSVTRDGINKAFDSKKREKYLGLEKYLLYEGLKEVLKSEI